MRLLAVAALLLLPITACHASARDDGPGVAGSGSGNGRSYPVANFTAIELAGADDVDVRVGSGYSVRAEGPAADLDLLRIDKQGDMLRIGRRRNAGSVVSANKVKLYVTLPRLAEAGVAGSGSMNVDRVEGASFKADIAGSGQLTLAALTVDKAEVSLAGSGGLRAAGTVKSLGVDIAGSGSIDAAALTARTASVSVAGSGNVRTIVNGPASVNIMGSGDVDLGPNARCTTSKMGSGTVRCGG